MEKTITKVIVCFLVIGIHLLIEIYPVSKNYAKKYSCEINIDSILTLEKAKKYTSFLSEEEKKEVLKIKKFQLNFCKNNILKNK